MINMLIGMATGLLEETKEPNVVEMLFEAELANKHSLPEHLNNDFPYIECALKNDNTIKVLSRNKIDIAPVVGSLADKGISILEAGIITPSLEDAFVKMTGIEIDIMKKEKEKK